MEKKIYSYNGKDYYTDGRFIYFKDGEMNIRLEIFENHYYKLRPIGNIPILEIDGLRMQLLKDFNNPLEYAKKVVDLVIGKKGNVLETCAGIGYITTELVEKNEVEKIVSIEISKAVIELAKHNPYSKGLFSKKTKLLIGNAFDVVRSLEDNFQYIIHDPPRYSHAPELYSFEFYELLYNKLNSGGILFHYVGSVGKTRGRKIWKKTKEKLEKFDFGEVKYLEKFQALLVHKV